MAASNAPDFGFRPIPAKPAAAGLVVLFGLVGLIAWSLPAWREFVIGLLGLLVPVGAAAAFLAWRDRRRGYIPPISTPEVHPAVAVQPAAIQTPVTPCTVVTTPSEPNGGIVLAGCLGLLLMLTIGGCFVYRNFIYDGPIPVVLDVALRDRPGFDFAYVANVKVQNNGHAGKVRVVADLKYGNFWTKHKVIDMAAGETQVVQIVFSEPSFLEGGLQAECEARAKPEWYFESSQVK